MASSTATLSRPAAAPAVAPVRRTRLFALPEMRWAAAALALFLLGLAAQQLGATTWLWWTLYLACYITGGWEPGLAGLQALRHKTLDVDLLMVVAAIGAASIGQVMDGGLLIVIFATSGALEALATARTEDSVRGLLDLAPDTATRLGEDGGEQTVKAVDLEVGDVILVRPGDRIAADGEVVGGASEVDQATITGEPLPVDKTVGDEVFAGTLNGTGALRVRVDRRAQDSVVARIAGLVEEASRTKAKTQLFIEKVEQRYSLGMVVVTIAVFVVPLLLGDPLQSALLRAMTFMIVASPCAVVLATMPPLLAAIANAGRHGVLVKSAVVMEQLGTTTRVAFDKTGTLTHGIPELADIRVLPGTALTDEQILRLAAAAEHPSEHPLGAAVVRAARAQNLELPVADEFASQPGRGVSALVDGHFIQVGSPAALLDDTRQADRQAGAGQAAVDGLQHSGHTAVIVLCDQQPVAVLAITDQIRSEAASTVAAVTELTGTAPILLTGDNAATATRLAGKVGITDVRAGLLPEDKVTAVQELQSRRRAGDRGRRRHQRRPCAGGGPRRNCHGRRRIRPHLANRRRGRGPRRSDHHRDRHHPVAAGTPRRGRQPGHRDNVHHVLVSWDLAGHLPLPLGVAGHEGSTIIVGLNGLRLLARRAWTPTRIARP